MNQYEKPPVILIVDDTPNNIKLLGEILGKQYEILFSLNGTDALAQAGAEPKPDLILLDVMMPGMDGVKIVMNKSNR